MALLYWDGTSISDKQMSTVVPVTLPPGFSLDVTKWACSKSVTAVTVIGIVVVSFNKDCAAGVARLKIILNDKL